MKIKAFFKKWVLNNIGYKLLALVFAFILWLIILNVTDPDATKTINGISVTIENEDAVLDGTRIYEIVSGQTTNITVSGSRSIVSGLSADDFVATADFSEITTAGSVQINVELTGDMSKYSNKVDITVKTTSMVIDIDEITTLKVPVEVVFTGEAGSNEYIDSVSVTPESVSITAPQSVLDTVASVVAYIDYSDVEGDSLIRTLVYIYDENGSEVELGTYGSADCSSVLVDVGASYTKTVRIYMDDPEDTTAEGYEFTNLTYSLNNVTIKGSLDLIEDIEIIEIPSALLDLTDAKSNVSLTVSISDYLPDGVVVYSDSSKVVITAVVDKSATTETTTEETTSAEESESSSEDDQTETSVSEETSADTDTESSPEETASE